MRVTWWKSPDTIFRVSSTFLILKKWLTNSARHSVWKTWCFVFTQQSLSSFRVWSSLLTASKRAQGALQYSQGTLTENEPQSRRDGKLDFEKKAEPEDWHGSYASEWERDTQDWSWDCWHFLWRGKKGSGLGLLIFHSCPFLCVPEGMSGLSRHTPSPWRLCINTREFADSQQQQTRAETFRVFLLFDSFTFFPPKQIRSQTAFKLLQQNATHTLYGLRQKHFVKSNFWSRGSVLTSGSFLLTRKL